MSRSKVGLYTRAFLRGAETGKRIQKRKVPESTRKYVNRRIRSTEEKKFKYLDSSSNVLSYDSPYLLQLNNIAPGTSDNTRIGDEIFMHKLKIKGIVQQAANANVVSRIIVFQWFSNSTPTLDDVISDTADSQAVHRDYNDDNGHRMKILYDKRMFCVSPNGTGGNKFAHMFSMNIPRKRFRSHVNYIAGSSTATTNVIYILGFSNVTAASLNGPTLNFGGSIAFKEK